MQGFTFIHVFLLQAHKSKSLITDINNRFLDSNTKEEVTYMMSRQKF